MEEALWNGIRLLQADDIFRLGTDSVLAADFLTLPKNARVVDLGAGAGTIGLLLCANDDSCHVTGVELQSRAAQMAQTNIDANALQDRMEILQGDLREIRQLLPANRFDCVISNPPYFPVGSGKTSADEALAIARTELCCKIDDVCAAAAWLLRYGGSFTIVHRPERLCDLICSMRAHRIEPKRIRFVRHMAHSPVCLVLLEGRSGAKSGLQYLPDLIEFEPDGSETAEYRTIYHR